MKILVTRPEADAAPISRALRERGAEVLAEPLLTIEPRPADLPDLDDAQALLFTSANGVRAFAARSERRDLPVHAVGDATAEAAREAGFGDVASAAGDVATLAAAVIADLKPDAGPLLQVAGTVSAGDLAGDLSKAGFTVERVVLYEAVPATRLSDALVAALAAGDIAGALFFSPRTAQLFLDLVDHARAKASLKTVTAYALSPAVAEILAAADFHAVVTAASPTLRALLAALDREPPKPAPEQPVMVTPVDEPVPDPVDPLAIKSITSEPVIPEPVTPGPGTPGPVTPGPVAVAPGVSEPPVVDPPAPAFKPAPAAAVPDRSGRSTAAFALLLLLVIVGVGASPWWAPSIVPLLPWGTHPVSSAAPGDTIGALAGRIASLEGTVGPLSARLDALDRKVAALPSPSEQPAALPSPSEQPAALPSPSEQPAALPSPSEQPAALPSPSEQPAALPSPSEQPAALPSRPEPPASAPVADLSAPVEALAARVARLEPAVASLATTSGRLDTLDARLRPVEQRLGAVEQTTRTDDPKLLALAPRVDELSSELAALQKTMAAATRSRLVEAVVPAAAAIRAAIGAGQPFAGPLAIVARDSGLPPLAADPAIAPALAVLTPVAAKGVDPLSQLRSSFAAAVAAIRAAAQPAIPAVAEAGWWVDAKQALGSVVQVTHTGSDAPGAEGPIARGTQALGHDDLGAAAAALHTLTGPAAQAAAPWLQRADARLAAIAAADTLVATVGQITLDAPPAAAPAP